jgi:PmbA protein
MDRDFARKLLDLAMVKGADEGEVYTRGSRNLGIDVKDQKVDTLESSVTSGYGIRVIKNGRLGFSYSTNPRDMRRVADAALDVALHAEPDKHLGFPSPLQSESVRIFDRHIASISNDEALEHVMLIEKSALDVDKRIRKIRKASGTFDTSDICIVNSKGIDACYSSTSCSAGITVVAEDGSDSQMGWDYEGSRFLGDVAFPRVGTNAAKRALQLLGAKKISSAEGFVIIENSIASEFLGMFASAFSSESVQKGKSMLAGKKEEQVISPMINIIDSGLLDGKSGSKPFDGEGVPTENKVLIDGGVLKGFLYDTYTARKEGVQSTGNAARGGALGFPGVGPTNLYLESSSSGRTQTFDELLKAVDKGLCVLDTMGMHTVNPVSGEFSVGVSGLWVEKGAVLHPVKEAVISGTLLNLFRQVVMVGDDLRFYGNIGAPSLLIESIDISG